MIREEYRALRYIKRHYPEYFSAENCPYDFSFLRELSCQGWLDAKPSPEGTVWKLNPNGKTAMRKYRRENLSLMATLSTLLVSVASLILQIVKW